MTLFRASVAAIALLAVGCTQPDSDPTPLPDSSERVTILEDSPAFWTVSDEDTTIHLFGTVHALKPGTDWKTIEFTLAFERADALYLESDVTTPQIQQRLAIVIGEEGLFTDGTILSDYLDEVEETLVQTAATTVGLPPETLQNLRPWFVSRSLADLYVEAEDYSVDAGVDSTLLSDAKSAGIELRYLEDSESIFRKLGALSNDDAADMLVMTARDIVEQTGSIEKLVSAWQTGDITELANIYTPEGTFGSREVYDVLIANRNRDWVEKIDTLMRTETGTYMIAVGAGHLAGPDSLISLLENRGIVLERR